jgi:hypothetical protein
MLSIAIAHATEKGLTRNSDELPAYKALAVEATSASTPAITRTSANGVSTDFAYVRVK